MEEWMYRTTVLWPRHQLEVWSVSRPGRLTPGTHWIGGWVDPRAALYVMEKWKFLTLQGFGLRPLGRPTRSQTLNRLRSVSSSVKVTATPMAEISNTPVKNKRTLSSSVFFFFFPGGSCTFFVKIFHFRLLGTLSISEALPLLTKWIIK
jgi:hypothetical protein